MTASRGVARKTPIAMSDVDRKEVENKLGNNELRDAQPYSGCVCHEEQCAYGDSKLNMRGFQSSNVAVMVNGVPDEPVHAGSSRW